jgi:hypothetical protein
MTTKKTFEAVAKILAATAMPEATRTALVAEMGKAFAAMNPRFNMNRFAHVAALNNALAILEGA